MNIPSSHVNLALPDYMAQGNTHLIYREKPARGGQPVDVILRLEGITRHPSIGIAVAHHREKALPKKLINDSMADLPNGFRMADTLRGGYAPLKQ